MAKCGHVATKGQKRQNACRSSVPLANPEESENMGRPHFHVWSDWRSALVIVKPETVIAWHQWQISGARHVAEPSRRNRAADLPPAQPLSNMNLQPGKATRWDNSLRSWVDRRLYWLRQPLSIE